MIIKFFKYMIHLLFHGKAAKRIVELKDVIFFEAIENIYILYMLKSAII